MAKRTIIECDLSKQEIDDDDVIFTLKLAKKGTRTSMTYELSSASAEKLLAQLNGRDELEEDWHFASGSRVTAHVDARRNNVERRTLGDLEFEEEQGRNERAEEARFVAEKKASLRDEGVIQEDDEDVPRETPTDGHVARAVGAKSEKCSHLNKGRIQTTLRNGKRFVYRKCHECRRDIPEKTKDERNKFINSRAPKGVNIRDIS